MKYQMPESPTATSGNLPIIPQLQKVEINVTVFQAAGLLPKHQMYPLLVIGRSYQNNPVYPFFLVQNMKKFFYIVLCSTSFFSIAETGRQDFFIIHTMSNKIFHHFPTPRRIFLHKDRALTVALTDVSDYGIQSFPG